MTRHAIVIAILAALAAAPATANRLLNESWIAQASYEQVKAAIAAGDDVNAAGSSHTPLIAAAHYGNVGAILALCEAGADGDKPPSPGHAKPMHFAADAETVALLLGCGGQVRAPDNYGSQPLHFAAMDSRLDAMAALIRRGADPNARDRTGNTPLHDAARYGEPAAAQILLGAGADINAVNRLNVTPLTEAARDNGPEMVELLLGAGADPSIRAVPESDGFRLDSAAGEALHNPKLRNHPVMARLLAGEGQASSRGCDGYVVLPTDRRLGDVAEKALGQRSRWPEIARLNGITAQAPHRVGQCLQLP